MMGAQQDETLQLLPAGGCGEENHKSGTRISIITRNRLLQKESHFYFAHKQTHHARNPLLFRLYDTHLVGATGEWRKGSKLGSAITADEGSSNCSCRTPGDEPCRNQWALDLVTE